MLTGQAPASSPTGKVVPVHEKAYRRRSAEAHSIMEHIATSEAYHCAAIWQRAAEAQHARPAADRIVHIPRPAVLAEVVPAARRAHRRHVVRVEADLAGLLRMHA